MAFTRESRHYLGLDGGGTKTAACILDDKRAELGRGFGGPCNIATCSDEVLRESVTAAVREALASAHLPPGYRLEGVCAGVAGYSFKGRRADFASILADSISAARHRIEPDFVTAFWGAAEGAPGVAVIAGTGAVTFGRNAEGESYKADGRGFILGDLGSGFHMMRQAISSLVRRMNLGAKLERGELRLLEAMGAVDVDDVIEWVYRDISPARIASLVPVLVELNQVGDEWAFSILQMNGLTLRSMARMARRRLKLGADSPVYTIGGLWEVGEPMVSAFRSGHPGSLRPEVILNVRPPLHDAAHGAALLAMDGIPDG